MTCSKIILNMQISIADYLSNINVKLYDNENNYVDVEISTILLGYS